MRKTYLQRYFHAYPDRAISRVGLAEAFRYIPSQFSLHEMIEMGITDGWLSVNPENGVDFYSLKHTNHE